MTPARKLRHAFRALFWLTPYGWGCAAAAIAGAHALFTAVLR